MFQVNPDQSKAVDDGEVSGFKLVLLLSLIERAEEASGNVESRLLSSCWEDKSPR